MAPSTPKRKTKRREYDTIQHTRFFNAFNSKEIDQGISEIARLQDINIPASTARLWLKQREQYSDAAQRSIRKTSSILGRKSKVSTADLKRITNQADPIHNLPYTKQAELLPNKPTEYTLRRHYANINTHHFKKPFISKVSNTNKPKRVKYSEEHEKETLTGY
jgi:hypothetical protein